jgi:hypothetical protein
VRSGGRSLCVGARRGPALPLCACCRGRPLISKFGWVLTEPATASLQGSAIGARPIGRRGRGQQVSLGHLFALLIVFAPGARCEVDQRAVAHEGDASPIAIDVPGGSFADEFAQRIAWAEARTFTYLNHGMSLQSLCRGGGSISFIRALHEFAIWSLPVWDE